MKTKIVTKDQTVPVFTLKPDFRFFIVHVTGMETENHTMEELEDLYLRFTFNIVTEATAEHIKNCEEFFRIKDAQLKGYLEDVIWDTPDSILSQALGDIISPLEEAAGCFRKGPASACSPLYRKMLKCLPDYISEEEFFETVLHQEERELKDVLASLLFIVDSIELVLDNEQL